MTVSLLTEVKWEWAMLVLGWVPFQFKTSCEMYVSWNLQEYNHGTFINDGNQVDNMLLLAKYSRRIPVVLISLNHAHLRSG